MAAYNAVAVECAWPKAVKLTPSRKGSLLARVREAGGLERWRVAMERAARSPFLRGDFGRDGEHANWQPSLEFFLQPKSFLRLLEGGYDEQLASGRAR